jgi:hypothetical protein
MPQSFIHKLVKKAGVFGTELHFYRGLILVYKDCTLPIGVVIWPFHPGAWLGARVKQRIRSP